MHGNTVALEETDSSSGFLCGRWHVSGGVVAKEPWRLPRRGLAGVDHDFIRLSAGTGSVNWVPRRVFLTRGVGTHRERLASFEEALRDAGIAHCNLVNVSSIFPPGCKFVNRKRGMEGLSAGQILFVVMSRADTNEYRRLVAASAALIVGGGQSIPREHGRRKRLPVMSLRARGMIATRLSNNSIPLRG